MNRTLPPLRRASTSRVVDILFLGLDRLCVRSLPFAEIVVLTDAVVGDVERAARQHGYIQRPRRISVNSSSPATPARSAARRLTSLMRLVLDVGAHERD